MRPPITLSSYILPDLNQKIVGAQFLHWVGYDCLPQSLGFLVEGKLIEPADCLWTKEKIEAACDFFETQRSFTRYVEMCRVQGCRYRTFLKALKDAAKRESDQYGIRVLEVDQLFVMHRMPARGGPEAIISFTLCCDVQERLERGETV